MRGSPDSGVPAGHVHTPELPVPPDSHTRWNIVYQFEQLLSTAIANVP